MSNVVYISLPFWKVEDENKNNENRPSTKHLRQSATSPDKPYVSPKHFVHSHKQVKKPSWDLKKENGISKDTSEWNEIARRKEKKFHKTSKLKAKKVKKRFVDDEMRKWKVFEGDKAVGKGFHDKSFDD